MDFGLYVEELRKEPLFRSLDLAILRSTESTNTAARRVVSGLTERNLRPRRLLLTAWEQPSGRGRRERPWISTAGAGITASLTVPIEREEELQTLPLAVAVAMCRQLGEVAGQPCRVKWPNDILLAGRKLVGILVEVVRHGPRASTAIVGFGVNRALPVGVPGAAGLVEGVRHPPALPRLTALVVEGLIVELDLRRAPAEIAAEYRAASIHRCGEAIRWKTRDGVAEGVFQGFDDRGFMRVSRDGAVQSLAAAELIEE
jgi:BirA family biotin operon repressor/biotin-[acetyl-CoA-carboxylase] ligase